MPESANPCFKNLTARQSGLKREAGGTRRFATRLLCQIPTLKAPAWPDSSNGG